MLLNKQRFGRGSLGVGGSCCGCSRVAVEGFFCCPTKTSRSGTAHAGAAPSCGSGGWSDTKMLVWDFINLFFFSLLRLLIAP